MENKSKITILIVVVVLIAIGSAFGGYAFQKSRTIDVNAIPRVNDPQDELKKKAENASIETQSISNNEITQKVGTVSMIDSNFIIIEIIDGSLQSAITKDTQFFKREGTEKTKASIDNVKVGSNVILRINSQTGEVVEVEIV